MLSKIFIFFSDLELLNNFSKQRNVFRGLIYVKTNPFDGRNSTLFAGCFYVRNMFSSLGDSLNLHSLLFTSLCADSSIVWRHH